MWELSERFARLWQEVVENRSLNHTYRVTMPRLVNLLTHTLMVKPAPKEECKKIVLANHYSGRMPGSKYCYGLYCAGRLVGCAVYSVPASYTLCRGVCGAEMSSYVIELARLVILTAKKNAASILIGKSLAALPRHVVVSYADCNELIGHVGYVYQATNWLYTGQGSAEPVWRDPRSGEVVSYTRRHIDTKAKAIGLEWTDLVKQPQVGKHRYVCFTGDRRFRKTARSRLKYAILPYPKGPTKRHSVVAHVVTNRKLNNDLIWGPGTLFYQQETGEEV
jgi:hypothetical protein